MTNQRVEELLKWRRGETGLTRTPTATELGLLQEVERLREALQGLSDMYARTWDRVDGALLMMPESVARFEAAHRKAFVALGDPRAELEST